MACVEADHNYSICPCLSQGAYKGLRGIKCYTTWYFKAPFYCLWLDGRKGIMSKLPYFQFYPADWISSPRIMCSTLVQQRAYIRLLFVCWLSGDGSIPDD